MLGHDRKNHCRILAPLGFVDRNSTGQNHLIKPRKVVNDWLSIKIDGQIPFLPVDTGYPSDINMETKSIEQTLKELVRERGLRKTAQAWGIDPASLYRSLRDGSNIKLERVKKLLDYLGYQILIVKKNRRGL